MKQIATFEKVSYEQFKKDILEIMVEKYDNAYTEEMIENLYNKIKIPKRATVGSAGYDFFLPVEITLPPQTTVKIPTGIRVRIDNGWVLKIYPRSGLGFKYRLQLDNTVGIIDSDYYDSDNEGHIFAKITNDSYSAKTLSLRDGDAFMQGIFVEYGITTDDSVNEIRNGGLGSTSININ